MQQFALIMRHEDGMKVASPEQIQEWMKQTMDWISGISAQNKFVSGTGLPFDDARVVRTTNAVKVVTNGPFGELYTDSDKDKARLNFEKAISLAKTSTDKQTIQLQIDNLHNRLNLKGTSDFTRLYQDKLLIKFAVRNIFYSHFLIWIYNVKFSTSQSR